MPIVPSPILRAFIPVLFFLVNIFALYLLLRGHDHPGGGFIAGLAAAISWILLTVTMPLKKVHSFLERDTLRLAVWGFFLLLFVGGMPLFFGKPFLSHRSDTVVSDFLQQIGLPTTQLFDIGIYLLVLGIVGKIGSGVRKAVLGIDPLTKKERQRYGEDA